MSFIAMASVTHSFIHSLVCLVSLYSLLICQHSLTFQVYDGVFLDWFYKRIVLLHTLASIAGVAVILKKE